MNLHEFLEQDEYCFEQNTPEGLGCSMCSGSKTEYCADRLRNTAGKLVKAKNGKEREPFIKELRDKYGMTSYAILALWHGYIELPVALED
jgi:hypothetical protein